MQRMRGKLTYANVMATLALIVAVAGGTTAIAAKKKPAGPIDVTKKGAIRPGHVTTGKLADGAVIAAKLADGSVSQAKLAATRLVQANGSPTATAVCSPGERLLSGGAESFSPAQPLTSSHPTAPPGGPSNGWTAQNTGGGVNVLAYALCLQ